MPHSVPTSTWTTGHHGRAPQQQVHTTAVRESAHERQARHYSCLLHDDKCKEPGDVLSSPQGEHRPFLGLFQEYPKQLLMVPKLNAGSTEL